MAGGLNFAIHIAGTIGGIVEPFGAEAAVGILQAAERVSLIVGNIFGGADVLAVDRLAAFEAFFQGRGRWRTDDGCRHRPRREPGLRFRP